MTLVCKTHGVTLTVEGSRRTYRLPPVSLVSPNLGIIACGLLTARDPRPGVLPVIDSNGRDTGLTCTVEEV